MDRRSDLENIKAALARPARPSSDYDLNPEVVLPDGRALRPAAVLIALEDGPNGPTVLLTKRASHLKHHPGQIAFPGGKIDDGDAGPRAAALREAWEEVGLAPENVDVLAELPCHETVTGYDVYPILAWIKEPFEPQPEAGEVSEVFRVPLSFLMRPENFNIEGRRWRGTRREYFVVPYGPYYIWGATARMLKALADRWPS